MAEYYATLDDYKWIVVTILLTIFLCWATQEILERKCGMAPTVITSKELHRASVISSAANPMKHYIMNKKLTKSLDHDGHFRIQTRGTIYFIKTVWEFIIFVTTIIVFIGNREWFIDHFYHLNGSSVYYMPYLHISSSIVAYYTWEVAANKYGRLTWSVLIHHWVTSGTAVSILLGRYSPFATWYGFTMVASSFPVFAALGFRAQFSYQYPNQSRKLFVFAFCWSIFKLIVNLTGQAFIILNALIYHYNESISIYFIGIMVCCIIAWLYDDTEILKALYAFSRQNYEDGEVLNKHEQSRGLAGRALFGQSVIQDLKADKLLEMTTEEQSRLNKINEKKENMNSNDEKIAGPKQIAIDINVHRLDAQKTDNLAVDVSALTAQTTASATLIKQGALGSQDVADIIAIQQSYLEKQQNDIKQQQKTIDEPISILLETSYFEHGQDSMAEDSRYKSTQL